MSRAATDRNLLFGILALQMDFVSKDALVRAMNAWILDKRQPLAQVLVEQGSLPTSRRLLLDALVNEHVQQHDDSPEKSLAALSCKDFAVEQIMGLGDSDVQASIGHLGLGEKALEATKTLPGVTPQRFQRLRPHARGNLGEVFLALDSELGREVALKEIQQRLAHDESCRARFVLEAEITGKLEHPGVVPVYGLGRYPDGRPFYAMRFIRGDSLKDAIVQFHKSTRGNTTDTGLSLRRLLARFVDVCNTIAYAHSRGVIHRDLKPANIMLGRYGETLVVDWGLAKALGFREDADVVSEPTLRPQSTNNAAETQPGVVVGTPQYMSPEQAAGDPDQIGPLSDIYSLGATLYCLLTGQPPFTDRDVPIVLRKVREGDFPAPRQIKRALPAALEAICLKAMMKSPEERFPSAHALADAIENWLADEAGAVARRQAQELAAMTALDRGAHLCEQGEMGRGLLWMARALEYAAPETEELSWLIRSNLGAWRDRLASLRAVAPLSASIVAATFSPDGRVVAVAAEDGEVVLFEPGSGNRIGDSLRHRARVVSLDISPDAAILAVGCTDGTVSLWNIAQCQACGPTIVHPEPVRHVRFSPDGKTVFYTSGNALFGRSVLDQAGVIGPLQHDNPVTAFAISEDGRFLVTGSAGGLIRLWGLPSGDLLADPVPNDGPITAVAYMVNETTFVAAIADGTVQVVHLPDGNITRSSLRHEGPAAACSFCENAHALAMVGGPSGARLWLVSKDLPDGEFLQHQKRIKSFAFSADGRIITTGSADHTARIWQVTDGKPLGMPLLHSNNVHLVCADPRSRSVLTAAEEDDAAYLWEVPREDATGRSHEMISRVMKVVLSPDSATAAIGVKDRAQLWDIRSDRLLAPLPHPGFVETIGFSADGQFLITGSDDNSARVWSVSDRLLLAPLVHRGPVLTYAFSPDGRYVVTGSEDHTARIWDIRRGEPMGPPLDHHERVYHVEFSPDGRFFVTIAQALDARPAEAVGHTSDQVAEIPGLDRRLEGFPVRGGVAVVRLWTLEGQQLVGIPLPSAEAVQAVAFSPDSRSLTVLGNAGVGWVFDVETGKLLTPPLQHPGRCLGALISPNGRVLATAGDDNSVRLWDLAEASRPNHVLQHAGPVNAFVYSLDGKLLVSGGEDQTARVWDVASGRQIGQSMPHADKIMEVAIAPDGRAVASAGADRVVRIWNPSLGRPIGPPFRHAEPVWFLAFGCAGRQVVTASGERSLRLFPTPSPIEGDVERVLLESEVATCMELDESGAIRVLSHSDWQQRRKRIATLSGSADTTLVG